MTSNDVRMETRASADMVGRTHNKGEKKVLSLRRILDGGKYSESLSCRK